jgi:hypothetical protein
LTVPNSHYRGVNSLSGDSISLTFTWLHEIWLVFGYSESKFNANAVLKPAWAVECKLVWLRGLEALFHSLDFVQHIPSTKYPWSVQSDESSHNLTIFLK